MSKRALLLTVALCASGCGKTALPGADADLAKLEQGVAVVKSLMSPLHLRKSMYLAAYPDGGTPSNYVSYFFSDMAAAEAPPSEMMAAGDPMLAEQARSIRQPLWPAGIYYFAFAPNQEKTCEDVMLSPAFNPAMEETDEAKAEPACCGCQIVLSADDEKGVVIVRGYKDPSAEPVLTEEIKLPKGVQADPTVEMFYQGNLESGMSPEMRYPSL